MDNDKLAEYGIDYGDGIARCLNNEELYRQILSMFIDDTSFADALAAFERKDFAAMFAYAHELKGVCGNSGLKPLHKYVYDLVEELRGGNPDEAVVKTQLALVTDAYNLACSGIKLFLEK